ncbi:cytochrome P450 [Alteraurantiacibacter aquimixticola]|uniref:Cytochrome P450 n=1 Tax=Alteraurantiacibacter aquimixticola TaxID=2489173 RepID=A0A4T3F4B3_9SPHN|nr:cytochrome P450 [Alteraurantiacibacter aquimixticola]TIX51164.1 cytochrome P450 [Alteraurantiacibacter aquimixticola]
MSVSQFAEPPTIAPEALLEDTHGTLRSLRRDHSLIRFGKRQFLVLRAEDANSVLADPRMRALEGSEYVQLHDLPEGAATRFFRDFFLLSNGQDHRTIRSLFAHSFSLGRMTAKRPQMGEVARQIAHELPRGRPFDFLDRMAARVPAEMIASLLGLDPGDIPYFSQRAYSLALAFSPIYPHDRHAEIEVAAAEMYDYVYRNLQDRLEDPRDDLLSSLATMWQDQRPISFSSLVHQVIGLILGGVDTTRAAFAMLVSLLLQHPEQWQAVKDDPALIPGAVAEGLRYDPSVGSVVRIATEPLEVCGFPIEPGHILRVSTMAALRDPEVYADPERFDVRRTDHPRMHPVFSQGPHRCIGQALAQIEMEEALGALVDIAPRIELVEAPALTGIGGIRQISPMIVRIA